MAKKITSSIQGREALKRGVDEMANAVKVTLGAKGRNVIIERANGSPIITKDGVTVAREIELTDPVENMGAQLIKDVASKTADVAGDGTTTATVLAQAIITAGLKNLTAGANPMDLKRGIDKAVKAIVKDLAQQSKPVSEESSQIEQIATISANNDSEIGKLIAEAMTKVKKDGVITVEESQGIETSVKMVDGMKFTNGFISHFFITNYEKSQCILEEPYIFLYDRKISAMNEHFIKILEGVVKEQKSLLFICDDVDGEALATLAVNKMKGVIKVAAVRAPYMGETRRAVLEDIAILTGGHIVSEATDITLENVTLEQLGRAKTIIIERNATTIIIDADAQKTQEQEGSEETVTRKKWMDDRIILLKSQIENATSDHEKITYKERLAKLTSGVAVLSVGAATEVEMKEKKDRVEDALHATRAACEEGIVAGGGVAYIRASKVLDEVMANTVNEDEKLGIEIIRKAIEAPLLQIIENAGTSQGQVVLAEVKKGTDDYGYNVRTEKFEQLITTGVIDPTKVSRVALENAASVASMFLTTECVISIKKEKAVQQPGNYMDDLGIGIRSDQSQQ